MTNYIHQFAQKPFFTAFLAIATILFLSSCKNVKTNKNPTCVQLTKAQMENWVKKGYTDTSSHNSVRFTTAYAGPGAVFAVYAVIQKEDGSIINESMTELAPIKNDTTDNCGNIKLNDYIFSGTIPARFSDLKILNPDGHLKDSVEYLKFVPYTYMDTSSKFNFLAYNIFNVTTGGAHIQLMMFDGTIGVGLPCPPCPNCTTYCPKICNGECPTGSNRD